MNVFSCSIMNASYHIQVNYTNSQQSIEILGLGQFSPIIFSQRDSNNTALIYGLGSLYTSLGELVSGDISYIRTWTSNTTIGPIPILGGIRHLPRIRSDSLSSQVRLGISPGRTKLKLLHLINVPHELSSQQHHDDDYLYEYDDGQRLQIRRLKACHPLCNWCWCDGRVSCYWNVRYLE